VTYTQSATITWNDGVTPAQPFTLSVDALNALEAFRLTVLASPGGSPRYGSVVELIRGYLNQYCVIPAIQANEPPAVATAHAAYDAAVANAITGGQIQ
jgi:hypothetical protein